MCCVSSKKQLLTQLSVTMRLFHATIRIASRSRRVQRGKRLNTGNTLFVGGTDKGQRLKARGKLHLPLAQWRNSVIATLCVARITAQFALRMTFNHSLIFTLNTGWESMIHASSSARIVGAPSRAVSMR